MEWEKFKNLNFLVRRTQGAQRAIALIHGYGANAHDLAVLHSLYRLKEPVDWYFPEGSLEVPIGPGLTGKAWFKLRVNEFETMAQGHIRDETPTLDEDQCLNHMGEWLNHMAQAYEKCSLGGFSQGAILTSHVFHRLNFTPQALLLFSGYLVGPSSIPSPPKPLKIPFFQSHGEADQVLPMKGARKLFDLLETKGLQGQWNPFPGGHEIPMEIIKKSQTFLNSL